MFKYYLNLCFYLFIFQCAAFETTEQWLIVPYEKNISDFRKCDIAICCVFQNEAEWLKEWIEFHRLIGVEHFYLYNNLSQDDYLEVLEPYVEEGIVELFDFPKTPFKNTDQLTVYNHALRLSREQNDWLAIIDTDEFITPMEQQSLKEYLKDKKNYGGIFAKWQLFGTSGVKFLEPDELLIEKLIYKAPDNDGHHIRGKSIVRPIYTKRVWDPHEAKYLKDRRLLKPGINQIRINHYYVRTEDFLFNVKIPRIKRWNKVLMSVDDLLDFLPIANSTLDSTMLRFVEPLRRAILERKNSVASSQYTLKGT
jgi:hypothetical protein